MPEPGASVAVDDVEPPASPKTDLDRLIDYLTDRFPTRNRELIDRQRAAASLKLKGELITLGFEAIDFRRELGSWAAMARRLRDERMADAYSDSHEDRSLQAEQEQRSRPSAKLVEAGARADVAPLNEALQVIDTAANDMTTIISWCQSLQRSVRDDEFGSLLESATEVPEELFHAPVGSALADMQR